MQSIGAQTLPTKCHRIQFELYHFQLHCLQLAKIEAEGFINSDGTGPQKQELSLFEITERVIIVYGRYLKIYSFTFTDIVIFIYASSPVTSERFSKPPQGKKSA